MITMTELEARLKHVATLTPGARAMQEAAQRAADRANAIFRAAKYPAIVTVAPKGKGWRLQLVQTGRVTQRVTGRTPIQVVRDELHAELPGVKQAAIAEIRQELTR